MVEFPRPEGFSHFGTADGEGYVIHATSGELYHLLDVEFIDIQHVLTVEITE